MAASFAMAWHGRMEKSIVTTQMTCRFASGMTYPGKLHHFKVNEVIGNIYDYGTLVVTLRDCLISLQRISLESRNSLFYFWVKKQRMLCTFT